MDALSSWGFFLIGLTGSLHCAGMCGPLIWIMPFQHLCGPRRWLAVMLYHAGRIAAYCILAAIFFSLREAFDPRWQQHVALLSGGLLVMFGALSFFGRTGAKLLRPASDLLIAGLSRLSGRRATGYFGVTGFLNGLLPCGMVYMALGISMKSCGLLQGMAGMAAFGAGTLPMLLAVTLLRRRIRLPGSRWTNAAILVFGMLVMLRGANLGIPYLSPARLVAEMAPPSIRCCSPAH